MKVSFVVTVEGKWFESGKPVTKAMIRKSLRAGVKHTFEFLADKVTVTEHVVPKYPTISKGKP